MNLLFVERFWDIIIIKKKMSLPCFEKSLVVIDHCCWVLVCLGLSMALLLSCSPIHIKSCRKFFKILCFFFLFFFFSPLRLGALSVYLLLKCFVIPFLRSWSYLNWIFWLSYLKIYSILHKDIYIPLSIFELMYTYVLYILAVKLVI